jgi:hypothetical protein
MIYEYGEPRRNYIGEGKHRCAHQSSLAILAAGIYKKSRRN